MEGKDIHQKANEKTINSEMLTFEEACQYLKVSRSFLYKATSDRKIAFYKPTGGKLLRFKKQDLDEWLHRNRCPSLHEIANESFTK